MTEKSMNGVGILVCTLLVAVLFFMLIGGNLNCGGVAEISPVDSTVWTNGADKTVTSLKGTEKQFAIREKQIADSIAAVYRTQIKDLKEYIIANIQSHSKVPVVPGSLGVKYDTSHLTTTPSGFVFQKPDSIHRSRIDTTWWRTPGAISQYCPVAMTQKFQSPYYSAYVQVGDSAFMDLTTYDSMTVVWKRVREGKPFHRKSLLQFDISFANPDDSISGLKVYRVPEAKPKRFAIGPQVGITYIDRKFRPYVGVGVSYNIIRF